MNTSQKIKCNKIDYRSGYIEVIPNIHPGCINIETWDVRTDLDISQLDLTSPQFPEDGVVGNCEIEMTVNEAKSLIALFQQAVGEVEKQAT